MTLLTVLASSLYVASLFDIQRIPLDNPRADIFLAAADADQTADIFVLDGHVLTAYPSARGRSPIRVVLPEGTSGFDIADIDGDARPEVIAVCGPRVVRHALDDTLPGAEPVTLLEVETQLSAPAPLPYPYVLTIEREGQTLLALPREDTFELRGLDGELKHTYPFGKDAPQRVSYGAPFEAWDVEPARLGAPGALEVTIHRHIEFEPDWPDGSLPVGVRGYGLGRRYGKLGGRWWSWFPLKTDGTSQERVLFSPAATGRQDTLVWIRRSASDAADVSERDVTIGPKRRYPGVLGDFGEDLPDFNADGYADLLLCQVPEPGLSVDGVTRALTGSTWPVEVTAHLYSPEKQRYEPRPATHVRVIVPLTWYLLTGQGRPLPHAVLRDFDGNGQTDFACRTAQGRYAFWLYAESGFPRNPDFEVSLDGRLEDVVFRASLDGGPRTSLGLRTNDALIMLYAVPRSRGPSQ